LQFEWDPLKAEANYKKHGVRFAESLVVFEDDYAVTIEDDESDPEEQRFVSIGRGVKGHVLVVVHLPGNSHTDHFSTPGNAARALTV
jgi:uncharacterized protein